MRLISTFIAAGCANWIVYLIADEFGLEGKAVALGILAHLAVWAGLSAIQPESRK